MEVPEDALGCKLSLQANPWVTQLWDVSAPIDVI